MAAFEYQALDAKGKTVKGITTGDHAKQVRAELRAQGLMPIDIKSVSEMSLKVKLIKQKVKQVKPEAKQRLSLMICR